MIWISFILFIIAIFVGFFFLRYYISKNNHLKSIEKMDEKEIPNQIIILKSEFNYIKGIGAFFIVLITSFGVYLKQDFDKNIDGHIEKEIKKEIEKKQDTISNEFSNLKDNINRSLDNLVENIQINRNEITELKDTVQINRKKITQLEEAIQINGNEITK